MTTFSWTGITNQDWGTASNWTPISGPPGGASSPPDTDVATLPDVSTAYTVTINSGNTFDINQLNIGGATPGSSTNARH